MSAPRPSEADVEARLVEYERAWLWNEATDETLAGWGYHMGQMLYRLPRDGQTRDMQASIEGMLADLRLLAARDAEHEREVAGPTWDAVTLRGIAAHAVARASTAERALADLRGQIEAVRALVDAAEQMEANSLSRTFTGEPFPAFIPAADLRALFPRDDAAGAGGAE